METKFRALRFIAMLEIVGGSVAIFAAVVAFVLWLQAPTSNDPVVRLLTSTGASYLIAALALGGLAAIGQGQFFQVIMQIEENTRIDQKELTDGTGDQPSDLGFTREP